MGAVRSFVDFATREATLPPFGHGLGKYLAIVCEVEEEVVVFANGWGERVLGGVWIGVMGDVGHVGKACGTKTQEAGRLSFIRRPFLASDTSEKIAYSASCSRQSGVPLSVHNSCIGKLRG